MTGTRIIEKEDLMVGDAVITVGAPYKGRISGICEDMPSAPFIVSLVHLKDGNQKVWRFSLDGKYTPQHGKAQLKKDRPS